MSNTPQINELLDELERLVAAATKGPWGICVQRYDTTIIPVYGARDESGYITALAECEIKDDARLIAAARNALPTLITELRRLRVQAEDTVRIASGLLELIDRANGGAWDNGRKMELDGIDEGDAEAYREIESLRKQLERHSATKK